MASAPPSPGCLSDIALRFSVESVQVVPGLLGAAVLVGIVLGAAAAAFLCFCLLLPRLSNKGKDPGVVLENSNSDIKRQDCRTESKNAIHPIRRKSLEEDNPFPSNGVAAFALKAKVVYPINQKFRPLADGASNPSLHESHKQTSLPNQMFEGSAYSSTESLSHGEKEDCSSSTTIHSITSEDRFYERTFPRVNSFLEVLTFSSCDVGLCLYSLCLQTLPLLDAELRREQHSMFLQILRINLTDLLLKKKIDGETFRNQLSAQEATEGFWIQIEKVHQFLLDQAKCSYAEAEKIMMDLTSRMTVLETVLSESQELQAMEVQEKMIRWEHMAKVVDSLRHQIQEESECRLNAVSKTLDNLKNQKKISVRQKEHHLTELFKAFWEEVSQYNNECLQQTKSLISKLLTHRGKLIEILRRTQKEERLNFLSKAQGSSDPDSFIKEYHKLLEEQRELSCDLEDEEDCKALDSVADLCKELYTGASQNFEKLVKSLFLQTLPEMTDLSLQDCESLKLELRQHLSSELEKAEAERKAKIKVFQETLLQEKQLWAQEQVRSSALQNYVSEKEQQIIKEVLSRLSGINEESSRAAAQRHDFFLRCALRPLALRNIAMATLTQMRMSRKKIVLQELKEHRCLERSKSHCQDEEQWKMQNEMEIHILEEERKLEAETQQARTDCQQQLLSDLAEALHLIRQHMQRAIGQTLVHYAQQEAAKSMMEDNMDFKERLVEAAVESVYVSRNSVEKLLRRYNQTMGQILGEFQVAKKHQLKAVKDKLTTEKQKREKKSQKDELCAQPTYSDFLKRFFLQQNQLLEKCQLYQQIGLDSVRQRKSVQHRLFGDLENKLKDAEEEFIAELASLARICLTDGSYSSNNKAVPSESTRKNLSTKKHM
uniref:EvC ciliary complex subunit 1 n=1 Tax=Xenopus tropicalis TaxID=8364 RepID=A0A6I8SYF2_XENTR